MNINIIYTWKKSIRVLIAKESYGIDIETKKNLLVNFYNGKK
jgi:hypothetical protein